MEDKRPKVGVGAKFSAIGFDYGGVIGGVGAVGREFSANMCQILQIEQARYKEVYFGLNQKINTGEVPTWREFWKIFLDQIGMPEKLEEVMALSDKTSAELDVIDERMLELADRLKRSGYQVGLLSNTTLEGGAKMRALGVADHFDVFHISAETRLMKPDPVAFTLFAGALGVPLAELIFIDDAEKSLSTARACGYTPILFENYEMLIGQLRELGVLEV